MKIDTNSWHYRVVSEHAWDIKENLCGYFWQVVGFSIWVASARLAQLAGLLLLAGIVLFLLSCIGISLHCMVAGLLGYPVDVWYQLNDPESKWAVFIGIGVIIWFLGFFWCVIEGGKWLHGRYRYSVIPTVEFQPNILSEYIKAKKGKYCPTIEFVRSDDT